MFSYLLTALFILASLINVSYAKDIPSCYYLAQEKNTAGASDDRAPIVIDNDLSFNFIKDLNGKRINYDWYFFFSKKDAKEAGYSIKWKTLSVAISSVQSLHGENADVYLVLYPESDNDKLMLSLGAYPESKVIGYGKYVMPKNLFNSNNENSFPNLHHKRLYKLIVY